jgi:hypothetical protein
MSWLYSQVLVEEYLAANSLDGEQFAPLSGSHTQQAFLSPDRMTAFSRLSRFGMTFKPLTESLGEDLLMWFREVSLARTFQQQEKAQESKVSDHPCGNTWRESSVKFDRNTHSWKTHRCLWDEDLAPSSLTLPKWGMMRSGVLWERITSPLHTDETESGSLLPTPTCADATMGAILNDNTKLITLKSGRLRKISNQGVSGSIGLARTVAMYPTPQVDDAKNSGKNQKRRETLASRIWKYPTPGANEDSYRLNGNSQQSNSLGAIARREALEESPESGGQLNPTWVEWLMGWPLGWTDLKPSGTDKCHKPQHSHGTH